MKTLRLSLFSILAAIVLLAPVKADDLGEGSGVIYTKEYLMDVSINDTMADSSASDTLFSGFKTWENCEYVLCASKVTGSGNDSIKLQIVIEAFRDTIGIGQLILDTVSDSMGGQILLPFDSGIVGDKYSVYINSVTGNGTAVVVGNIYIYVRRPRIYMLETKQ